MNSPLITLYYISAGGLLVASGYAVFLAQRSVFLRSCRMFALLCLCFLVFQVANAFQHEAQSVQDLIAAHKWVNASQLAILGLCGWFIDLLTRRRYNWLSHCLASGALLALIINFTQPYGYRFSSMAHDYRFQMVWGETLSIPSGQRSACQSLVMLLYAAVVLKTMLAIRLIRPQPKSTLTRCCLVAGLALVLPSVMVSMLSDAGYLHFPYIGGFCLTILACTFAFQMRQTRASEFTRFNNAYRRMRKSVQHYREAMDRHLRAEPRSDVIRKDLLLAMLNTNASQPCAVLAIKVDGWEGLTAFRSMRQRDELEAAIEHSLHSSLVASESIARAGSNLYIIMLLGVTSKADASASFARICHAFDTSRILPMRSPNVQLVAGIALRSLFDTEPEQLVEAAELALRQVNRNNCPSPHFYHTGLGESWRQQMAYEDALASAVRNGELRLHFQPQVACEDGSPLAIEALVRWQHPVHGMIPPAQFIPIAEAAGHIDQIGAWVIEQGIRQLRVIKGHSGLALRLAINVSPQQLLSRELERHLANCLQRYGVAACEIELEVTESVAMEMPDVVISHLQRLRNQGFRLAIDDFGTGYSSLSYLQHLPVHVLKLDRSFIRNLTDDPKALSICRNTIRMARDLGLELVAEGVETAAQAADLRRLGCDILQGYHFAPPLPLESLLSYLQRPLPSAELFITRSALRPGCVKTQKKSA